MRLHDIGLFLRGRLTRALTRVANARAVHAERRDGHGAPAAPVPLESALAISGDALALVGLLEARTNPEREAAVAAWLEARGIPFTRHRFQTFEGSGENFAVEVGSGDRVVVLIAHHDAVPGSPGANDNAAAVGILLSLLDRLSPPPRLRVRLLFTAAEELGYLGARAYVADTPLDGVEGVLSLELCGIGDTLAIWDAIDEPRFLARARRTLEGLGMRADEDYHVVGRIPVFGSDHRAFAPAGIPAYGLTVVPRREAEALRSFVFNPVRGALTHLVRHPSHLVRRPPPFDTYHTPRDASATLDPAALALVGRALDAIIAGAETA